MSAPRAYRRSRDCAPPRLSPRVRTRDALTGFGGVTTPRIEPIIPWLGAYTPAYIPTRIKRIMRRSAMIRLGEIAVKSPFRGITYRATGGDARTRAFVEATFLRAPIFAGALAKILNALVFGFAVMEIRWALRDVVLDLDGPGGLPPTAMPRAYVIRDLVDLDPERVALCVDEWGDPDGIEYDGVLGTFLGEESIIRTSFLPEFQDWYGSSILDGAYDPWFEAQHTKRFHGTWNERKSDPPYKGFAPDDDSLGQRPDEELDGQGVSPVQVIARAAMAVRSGGVCALPSAFDERGNRLWDLVEIDTQNRTNDFLAHRRYLDDMQLRGMLVPERTITQEGVGSYSMADVHVGVFLGLMEVIRVDLVLDGLNKVAEKIVRVNFGRAAPVPRIESSELNRQSKALLAAILEKTLETPRMTAEGVAYRTSEIIDDIASLEALNIPHHRPRSVEAADQATAGASAAIEAAVPEPTEEQLARFDESAADVGARYRVGAGTVRKWGRLAPTDCVLALPGGRYRFCGTKLDAWIASGAPAAAPEPADVDAAVVGGAP